MAANAEKRLKTKYTNRFKVLVCYLLAFGLALALPQAALRMLYPYKLAGSAPDVLAHIVELIPAAEAPLATRLRAARLEAGMTMAERTDALRALEQNWLTFVSALLLLAWALTLLLQLLWRLRYRRANAVAAACARAVRGYRWLTLLLMLLNLACAAPIVWLGVRFIAGVTVWDALLYFGGFPLNVVAAVVCFRLAAPPAISGRHAFFRRL